MYLDTFYLVVYFTSTWTTYNFHILTRNWIKAILSKYQFIISQIKSFRSIYQIKHNTNIQIIFIALKIGVIAIFELLFLGNLNTNI